jgi:glycosyltransferase family protein
LFHKSGTPKVLTLLETLQLVKDKRLSFIRFGDGEIASISKHDLLFQKKDIDLANSLQKILHSNHEKLLICVPPIWEKLNLFTSDAFRFQLHHLLKYRNLWKKVLSKERIYGNAFITRPYLIYKNKTESGKIFAALFSLWEKEHVVLIEGEKTRMGVGNDMFSNTLSVERILCPAENAYSKYEEIKKIAVTKPKDRIIILSLGPTAKVLAYELFLLGYRVFDAGHTDMEYEMFLRKEDRLVKVQYKYFSEIDERNPEECKDTSYLSQIVAKIV